MAIMLDFSKAFDTLNHATLISKLDHVGVRGPVLGWLSSYLNDRKQFVSIGSSSSEVVPMTMGVPQGSVLGPLLFLIYINDMCKVSNFLHYVHFADDTMVFASGGDLVQLVNSINVELHSLDDWLKSNRLSLNLLKTSYMVISHNAIPDSLDIKIRNTQLKRVREAKFLGVLIDDGLTFASHVGAICARLSRTVGVMRRLSSFVPATTLLNIYYSLFHSYCTYAITAWGGSACIHINRLQSLQNRAVRFLPIPRDSSSVYVEFSILNIKQLYNYFCAIKFYRSYVLGQHSHFSVNIRNGTNSPL